MFENEVIYLFCQFGIDEQKFNLGIRKGQSRPSSLNLDDAKGMRKLEFID